jgi:hypothetical protein
MVYEVPLRAICGTAVLEQNAKSTMRLLSTRTWPAGAAFGGTEPFIGLPVSDRKQFWHCQAETETGKTQKGNLQCKMASTPATKIK